MHFHSCPLLYFCCPQTQRRSHGASRLRGHLSPLQGHLPPRHSAPPGVSPGATTHLDSGGGRELSRSSQEAFGSPSPPSPGAPAARSAAAVSAVRPVTEAGRGWPRLPHRLRAGAGRGRGRNLGRGERSKPGCSRGGLRGGGDSEPPGEGVQRFPGEHDAGGD